MRKRELNVTGCFDLYIVPNLENYPSLKEYEHTGKIDGREWSHIFYRVIGCPTFQECLDKENFEEAHKKYAERFKRATSNFPMLYRLEDIHKSVLFDPEQLNQLREEINQILPKAETDEYAFSGLNKLLSASQLAIKRGNYLLLEGW